MRILGIRFRIPNTRILLAIYMQQHFFGSVVDPDSLNLDQDPAFQVNTDPDPDFDDKKLEKNTTEKFLYFFY
jgi:hypothetical protein